MKASSTTEQKKKKHILPHGKSRAEIIPSKEHGKE